MKSFLRPCLLASMVIGGLATISSTAMATPSICDGVSGNLVSNCGFEGGTYSSTIGGNTNNSVPNNWLPSAGYDLEPSFNHTITAPPLVNSGTTALSIGNDDGQPVPTLSQTLTDVSGSTYNGSVYVLYGAAGTSDTNVFFDLSINGSDLVALNNTASGANTQYTFSFVGTGSDLLTLGGNTSPSEWYVDDVVVTGQAASTPPSVPEPGTLFLAGLGLLALAAGHRKAKKH
ncbi:PEP-CTERM sorting domain-containing protein [Solimicrobium silvestre]|uniref:PEP-CTERM protein-sorting domain n=1 Tax=Solimicrobium silvestre TaxID=2099400 RepID=A0A2S9GW92_9BURK|nr:PEP-CTERM sorting domain-containing protein [Solimicrobium silvestre]PRC91980.1 PEP-CTERM protein-sorting domain [Solimicrobium silvestre]